MAALRKPGGFFATGRTSDRATRAAFKAGDRVFKKTKGATPLLREVVRLYRESTTE